MSKRNDSQGRPRKGGRLGAIAPWAIIILGLFLLVRPIAVQWYEAWEAARSIDAIVATYDVMGDPERAALREEARAYNADLFAGNDLSGHLPYEEQLVYRDSEMIAYITIPKCSVKLPIYHGTDNKALMAGVGHLGTSSLPAGGESSHCVLTAHTGMPGRRMFDDIHLLEPGDRFVIWVLGEALAYEVLDSEVILPEETDSLVIQEGRDLVTLITCTPYGINTHRLLVHAERCEYVEGEEDITDLAVYVNGRTLPFIIAAIFVLLLLLGLIWRRLRKWREKRKEKAEQKNGNKEKEAEQEESNEREPKEDKVEEDRTREPVTDKVTEGEVDANGCIMNQERTSQYVVSFRYKVLWHTEECIILAIGLILKLAETITECLDGARMHVRQWCNVNGVGRLAKSGRLMSVACAIVLIMSAVPRVALAQEKKDEPLVVTFDVREGSNALWKGIADYAQGQDVPFEVIGSFPQDLGDRNSFAYWLVMDFPASIDYQEGSIRATLRDGRGNETDVTPLLTLKLESREIRVGSDDILASLPKLEASCELALFCEGRLNDQAGMGFDHGNTVWAHMEYEGRELSVRESGVAHTDTGESIASLGGLALLSALFPLAYASESTDLNRSVDMPTTVYTYEIEIIKIAADTRANLAGAKFALRDKEGLWYVKDSDWSENQDDATVVETNEYGRALFKYVDSEYYEVVELEAPEGYELCEPIDVDIETDVPAGSSATYLTATSKAAVAVAASSSSGHVNLSIQDEPDVFASMLGRGTLDADSATDEDASNASDRDNSAMNISTTTSRNDENFDTTSGTNVIQSRQGLSITGDESPWIWPWLFLSVLCLLCAVYIRRSQKGLVFLRYVRGDKSKADKDERKHYGN